MGLEMSPAGLGSKLQGWSGMLLWVCSPWTCRTSGVGEHVVLMTKSKYFRYISSLYVLLLPNLFVQRKSHVMGTIPPPVGRTVKGKKCELSGEEPGE